MRQVAAEMQIDAQQAIDSLRKDKQLWDRVERLKQDIATCKRDVSEHDNAVSADTGMCQTSTVMCLLTSVCVSVCLSVCFCLSFLFVL